jgi:hypothetical protein
MANKTYNVGPQDGWIKVLTVAAKSTVRISIDPITCPFYVYSAPSGTPTATDRGIKVACDDDPFLIENFTAGGNVEAFWVRVVTPSINTPTGQAFIDVYTDGGTLV